MNTEDRVKQAKMLLDNASAKLQASAQMYEEELIKIKNLGYASIEEAEQTLKQIEKDLPELDKKINTLLDKALELLEAVYSTADENNKPQSNNYIPRKPRKPL